MPLSREEVAIYIDQYYSSLVEDPKEREILSKQPPVRDWWLSEINWRSCLMLSDFFSRRISASLCS